MARAGVSSVAMVAAGISAAVLGYAVIWSYSEPEVPPAIVAIPPSPEQSPVAPAQDTPATPAPAVVADAAPAARPDQPQASPKQDVPLLNLSVPEPPVRMVDAIAPPIPRI